MLSQTLKNALLNTPLCQYLDAKELEHVVSHNEVVSFKAQQLILKQGQRSEGIYLIIHGKVLITAKVLGEGTTHIATLGLGNYLGETSVIGNFPASSSAHAETDVQCLFISSTYFKTLHLFHPQTGYKILLSIAKDIITHLINLHQKIAILLREKEMVSRSLFAELIKTFSRSIEIDFKNAEIDENLLRNMGFFSGFSDIEFTELLRSAIILKTPKRCVITEEGSKNASCYIVLRGAVQSSIIYDNKVAKLSVIGPISLFCPVTLIDNHLPAIVNYTTCEEAILFKIMAEDVLLLQKNNPKLWFKLFNLICKSFVGLERYADKLEIRLNSEFYNR